MTDAPSTLIRRLRDAEALFRLDWDEGRAALVAAATGLLVEGVSSVGIVALAGDDHAEKNEIERDLRSSLDELGLAPLDIGSAAVRRCRAIAREMLEGHSPARPTAKAIWDIYVAAGSPAELNGFAYVADGLDDFPGLISEQEYRAAAEAFLAQTED